jgi:hypothetical protein
MVEDCPDFVQIGKETAAGGAGSLFSGSAFGFSQALTRDITSLHSAFSADGTSSQHR